MFFLDNIFAALLGSCISFAICHGVYLYRGNKKRQKVRNKKVRDLEKTLPAFLDNLSSSLSAGNSLQQSIETASEKDQTQLGTFIKAILLRVKSGMTLDTSLKQAAENLPGSSLSLALLSMSSSYRSGSNMIESLALLSTLCQERVYLRKKILARTAQSRAQGYVLIFVPILFMLLLFIISPHNMMPVLKSSIGRSLLLSAAILQCLGGLIIRAMLRQDIL